MRNSQHELILSNAAAHWQAFEAAHKAEFVGNKYVAVDAQGNALGKFATNSEAKRIQNAGSVRHEDYLSIQEMVTGIRRRKLTAIEDLMSAGLSFNEDISNQLVGFEKSSDMTAAKQSMNPNMTEFEGTSFTEEFVPCPITHKGFTIPFRQGSFDYKRSIAMENAIRYVAERLEQTLVAGNTDISVSYGGVSQPLYGYTTHPQRGTNATTISDFTDISNITSFYSELIREVGLMWSTQGGIGENSLMVYVGNGIYTNLQEDYKADSERSVMERARAITQVRDIKPLEKLGNNEVLLVEMESSTIQLAVEAPLQVVPFMKSQPFEAQKFGVFAAMTHLIKADQNGNTGVRHLTVFP